MRKVRENVLNFIKREMVLSIAVILAVVSLFLVPPDKKYMEYIDISTLAILFCLMAIIAGIKETGAFDTLAKSMICKVKNIRQMTIVLVLLCFFFSMVITNDVALITFVPFTLVILQNQTKEIRKRWIVPIVVLQTVAANMGSMLTPIGNPQNLYLYGKAGISCFTFVMIMLPYTIVAFACIVLFIFGISRKKNEKLVAAQSEKGKISDYRKLVLYLILWIPTLLTVAKILDDKILFVIVLVTVIFFDRKILTKVDYSLLLTFAAFFIFIGNMGRFPAFCSFLSFIIEGREVMTAVFASQFISNVPAALLLSGFTGDYQSLMIGTNIGGLGTLIASMASLISYKLVTRENPEIRGNYMREFTIMNVLFLGAMLFCNIIMTNVF